TSSTSIRKTTSSRSCGGFAVAARSTTSSAGCSGRSNRRLPHLVNNGAITIGIVPRHTGYASLPLHGGKAPPWLFSRMVRLSREIVIYLASEFGTREVLRRLSDPFWFQAFGCVLGFDWHSSGVTTTVCGAVKEGLKDIDQ